MINKYKVKEYCCEDISNIENYEQAVNDKTQIWDCHHKGEVLPCGRYTPEDLKKFNLYYNRPANELIFLTHSDHMSLHHKGQAHHKGKHHSDEARRKISEARKGKHLSEETRKKISVACKGRILPDDVKQKLADSIRGRKWYNDGIQCYQLREDDPKITQLGLKLGRLKKKGR